MLNTDLTRFIQNLSRVRQNRASERKVLLSGWRMRLNFPFKCRSAKQTQDRKRTKKQQHKIHCLFFKSTHRIYWCFDSISFFIRLRRRAHVRSGVSISSREVLRVDCKIWTIRLKNRNFEGCALSWPTSLTKIILVMQIKFIVVVWHAPFQLHHSPFLSNDHTYLTAINGHLATKRSTRCKQTRHQLCSLRWRLGASQVLRAIRVIVWDLV